MHLPRPAIVFALLYASIPLHATSIAGPTPLAPGASVVPLTGNFGGTSRTQTTFSNSSFGFVETLFADTNNPLCPNFLEFVITVQNNNSATSGISLQTVSTEDFTGFQTDVAFASPSASDVPPTFASRTQDGSEIIFYLNVPPGGTSDALIIYTDATNFGPGNLDVGTSLATIDPPTFAPTAATTPEPSSFVLLGTGLLSIAGALKRRLT